MYRSITLAVTVALSLGLFSAVSAQGQERASTAVLGGERVSQERYDTEFPYMVALLGKRSHKSLLCGGTLIAPRWVLTAAHCKLDDKHLLPKYAVIGRADLRDGSRGERIAVVASFQHPDWLGGETLNNDLMLLQLARPVASPHPVELQRETEHVRGFPSGREPIAVAGWGKTAERGDDASPVLRVVSMPFHGQRACRKNWGGDPTINELVICAGDASQRLKSACNGDSGGPAIYQGRQVGIVSFGGRGCHVRRYNVFTNVAAYAPFLDQFFQRTIAVQSSYYMLEDRGRHSTALIELRNPSDRPLRISRARVESGPVRLLSRDGRFTDCFRVVASHGRCWLRVQAKRLRGRQQYALATINVYSDSPVGGKTQLRLFVVR